MKIQVFSLLLIAGAALATTSTPEPSECDEPTTIPVVGTVHFPGIHYTPSTGKELRVFELNNQTLRGRFVAHDDRVIYFRSTCSGVVRIWKKGGFTIVDHEYLSKERGIHFADIEGHRFVYGEGQDQKTYSFSKQKSKREAVSEYDERSSLGHDSDDEPFEQAIDDLSADLDVRLLAALSQALGEFGIYGYTAPCSLPLHATAMSISRKVGAADIDNVQFHLAERNRSCHHQSPQPQLAQHRRAKRGWFFAAIVQRIVEPLIGATFKCSSLEANHHNDCVGMCGKGCSCWKWVCGNCCFHRGCYQHDLCRGVSFYIPVNFSCSGFTCW
eukprot:m.161309 g.161309  ORF g.161309 m.161309 type:complete len:328 (+) comp38815_c0_seq2:2296-3279(+)